MGPPRAIKRLYDFLLIATTWPRTRCSKPLPAPEINELKLDFDLRTSSLAQPDRQRQDRGTMSSLLSRLSSAAILSLNSRGFAQRSLVATAARTESAAAFDGPSNMAEPELQNRDAMRQ